MARNRQNLNIIYISDRMRETLRPIASCALTAVVAPMGYGKTTAVRWFLAEQAKAGAVVLQASIYSDNRSIFWKSVQKAFAAAGLTVLEGYDCPADASGAALLLEDLCAALGGKTPYYLFLDDFHLLGDERVAQFLCRLAYRLPENVHLIVASRNRFLPGEQVVRLGRRLHRIEADGLRLNREELLAYTHRCGVEITAAQAESLLRSCEGWFSAVYLNLHALAERGSLLQPGSDIHAMFTAAMLESLPEKTRGFLAVMGLADEFTVEMARLSPPCPTRRRCCGPSPSKTPLSPACRTGELPLPPHDERVRRAALCPAARRPANGGLAAVWPLVCPKSPVPPRFAGL